MIHVESEQAMKEVGRTLGAALSESVVLELVGDVGAGKTTLVKGLAAGLEIDEDIQSPSFTINRTYDARDGLVLSHYDFYRLHDPGIMADELRDAASQPKTIIVIEWADIVSNILPAQRLTLVLRTVDENSRSLEFEAHGEAALKLKGEIAV